MTTRSLHGSIRSGLDQTPVIKSNHSILKNSKPINFRFTCTFSRRQQCGGYPREANGRRRPKSETKESAVERLTVWSGTVASGEYDRHRRKVGRLQSVIERRVRRIKWRSKTEGTGEIEKGRAGSRTDFV